MSNHDLNWLAAQRPQRSGADPEAHDRALLSLLRHASSRPGERRRARELHIPRLLQPRLLTVATAAGLAAVAAAVVLSIGGGAPAIRSHGSTRVLQALGSHHKPTSSLLRLADDLSTSTAKPGDATLIQRTTHTPSGQDITVYDLYGDNGTYYFSHDESGMPAQVSGNDNQGAGLFAREVAAARQAATGNVAQAAIAMANAPDPNRRPLVTPSNSALTPQQIAAEKVKAKIIGVPVSPGTLFDNWAWEDSQDAIIAGAGDPQVRAGVLQILATLPGVTVTHGTSGGQPTLILTGGADEVGTGYQEQLTINAESGMPIGFAGGKPGGSAGLQVDYRIARVTLSDVAAGQLPSF